MRVPPQVVEAPSNQNEDIAALTGAEGWSHQVYIENDIDFLKLLKDKYKTNTIFKKILSQLDAHIKFSIRNGIIWTNGFGWDVICIPDTTFSWERKLVKIIIDQAHKTAGHFGIPKPESKLMNCEGSLVASG